MEQLKALFTTFMFMAATGVLILTIYYMLILAIPLFIIGVVGFIVHTIYTE